MGIFTEEIAIDLGTANTLIIHNDKVVINSPSVVAIDRTTNKIIAIGEEANIMQGKTHENIKTVRPLKDGVIADFEASEQMISTLIKSIPTLKKRWFSPSLTMVICIPSGMFLNILMNTVANMFITWISIIIAIHFALGA